MEGLLPLEIHKHKLKKKKEKRVSFTIINTRFWGSNILVCLYVRGYYVLHLRLDMCVI